MALLSVPMMDSGGGGGFLMKRLNTTSSAGGTNFNYGNANLEIDVTNFNFMQNGFIYSDTSTESKMSIYGDNTVVLVLRENFQSTIPLNLNINISQYSTITLYVQSYSPTNNGNNTRITDLLFR